MEIFGVFEISTEPKKTKRGKNNYGAMAVERDEKRYLFIPERLISKVQKGDAYFVVGKYIGYWDTGDDIIPMIGVHSIEPLRKIIRYKKKSVVVENVKKRRGKQ